MADNLLRAAHGARPVSGLSGRLINQADSTFQCNLPACNLLTSILTAFTEEVHISYIDCLSGVSGFNSHCHIS